MQHIEEYEILGFAIRETCKIKKTYLTRSFKGMEKQLQAEPDERRRTQLILILADMRLIITSL